MNRRINCAPRRLSNIVEVDYPLHWIAEICDDEAHSGKQDFRHSQLEILMVLSNKDFTWRSIDGLRAAVRLSEHDLSKSMKDLIERKLVRVSATKDMAKALFGLAERVDPELGVKYAFKRWPY